MNILRASLFVAIASAIVGCGGSSSNSTFEGVWTGSGTLVNSAGATVASGTVNMTILSGGTVTGSDNVTLDGGTETESGAVGSPSSTLALTEITGTPPNQTTKTYSVVATVTLNSSNQLVWSGTETISGTNYTLNYVLTEG